MLAGVVMAVAGTATCAVGEGEAPLTTQERDALMSRMLGRTNLVPKDGRPAFCFVENPTPEQMKFIMERYDALPPTQANDRFFTTGTVWAGAGGQGASGRAVAAQLKYSFPNDGVLWGDPAGGQLPNDLNARFIALFSAANLDRGREYVRQGLASWRKYTGLTYTEVSDNNTQMDNSTVTSSTRGDVRIGSIPQGNTGVLAFNFFPTGGSDMTFNSNEFQPGTLASTANSFRYFRNVTAHEHGHGLGFIHTTPCNQTKLMEPFASTAFEMVRIDDRRGGQRNYGDRFTGNNSGAAAKDFGDLTSPSVRSVIERNLSTNGTAGFNNSDEDWFKFTLSSPQNVTITVAPTGGSYQNGQQTSGCNPTAPPTIASSSAGNLDFEFRNGANGGTVVQSASSAAAGVNETLTLNNLAAGTYWVRVFDVGPNTAANQTLQLYDLTVRVGTSFAPPFAIAGINKRIAAGTNCFFMGDLNSEATEAGGSITSYAWDFDGDGTFDNSFAQPLVQYSSNGLFNVTLRVTDNNGMTDTDTIQLVVFNAGTTLTSVTPSSSGAGATVPVTIVGTNFRGVSNANQISVSGVGVSVTGTPVVNGFGTQITGLSFAVAGNAPLGPRDVTVINSDGAGGTATLAGGFTVTGSLPVNDECSGALAWPSGAGSKPFLNDFATDSTPQSFGGTGCSGNLFNDVWYTWAATSSNDVTVTSDSAGAGFSSRVAVYDNACPIGAPIACGEFGQAFQFSAVNGTTYLFRVGSAVPNVTGTANVILTLNAATGACCRPEGTCFLGTAAQCIASNSFQGAFSVCSPLPCPPPSGACCATSGACSFVTNAACNTSGGMWFGFGTSCTPNDCPQPEGACCASDGSCSLAADVASCSGTFQGAGSACSPNPCPQPNGACCASDGSCSVISPTGCSANSGAFQGSGTACSPNPCPQPTGACCSGSICFVGQASACTGANQAYAGNGTMCNAPANTTTPCCKADFNGASGVSVQDIFDFLAGWFAGSPQADFNGVNGISVQDIFDFLAAWFAGC